METNEIGILRNTLEQMLADCEDNGREGIQPMLTPDDVILILNALKNYEDLCTPCAQAASQTCGAIRDNSSPFAETVEGMLSSDYKERFKAEYHQTKIRYERLKRFNVKIEAAKTYHDPLKAILKEPKHDCPYELLREQQRVIGEYLHILEIRAAIENIEL